MTVLTYLSLTVQGMFVVMLCVVMIELCILSVVYSWKITKRIMGDAEKNIDKAIKWKRTARKETEETKIKVVSKKAAAK